MRLLAGYEKTDRQAREVWLSLIFFSKEPTEEPSLSPTEAPSELPTLMPSESNKSNNLKPSLTFQSVTLRLHLSG